MGASEQPSLTRLVEIFGGVKPGWLTNAKNDGCG
jgi:hypothetical protein